MPSAEPLKVYFDEIFVQQVRNKLLDKIQKDSDLYDKSDVHKLLTSDWFVRRFLAWKPTNIETAVKCVNEAMKWRKNIGVNEWSDIYFPAEFYQLAVCFDYLPDKEDNNILILRLRANRKDPILKPDFDKLARKYFIHTCEKIVNENSHRGFSIIFDCNQASLSNVDLDFARFIISTLSSYYAGALTYVCVYELPWIFNQVWKIVRTWLDSDAKKLVRFATKKDINKLIATENLPDYMGGSGLKDHKLVPKGAPNVEEVANQFGFKCENDIKKVVAHFQRLIEEFNLSVT